MTSRVAFFGPQSKPPTEIQLLNLHRFLASNQHGRALLRGVIDLERQWTDLKRSSDLFDCDLPDLELLSRWADTGASKDLVGVRSAAVVLPLLLVFQIGQYIQCLENLHLDHASFSTQGNGDGAFQGSCAGLASAIILACSKDEFDLTENAVVFARILLAIGSSAVRIDQSRSIKSSVTALQTDSNGVEELLSNTGARLAAVLDQNSISVAGDAKTLEKVRDYAQKHQIQAYEVVISGSLHDPQNEKSAVDLIKFCNKRFPFKQSDFSLPRSNITTNQIPKDALVDALVRTILVSVCDWNQILKSLAAPNQAFVGYAFGLNDCFPLTHFPKSFTKGDVGRFTGPSHFPDDTIAIVGAACRLPGANDLDELESLLRRGESQHSRLPKDRFDISTNHRNEKNGEFFGNFLDDVSSFDNTFFRMSAREAASLDPQQRILLELSYEALEDSGYISRHERTTRENVGCFIGASFVEYLENTSSIPATAYTATGTIRAFLCGRLSHFYGWTGPAEVVDTACSSSLVAVHRACNAIRAGECEMALTGGVNTISGVTNYLDLSRAGFLSPSGQCRVFDESADGYCRSEGAGLVVLKSLKRARIDGDKILGLLPASKSNQSGLSTSLTVPDPIAQEDLFRNVLNSAGLAPEQISYVEAHGTGTQVGDPIEVGSLRSVFGKRQTYIGSLKGNIGHCETAAGIASLMKVLVMLRGKFLPPQASFKTLNSKLPSLPPLSILKQSQEWDSGFCAAMVNSYGAGGSNCAVICCEGPGQQASEFHGLSLPVALSAANQTSLEKTARNLGRHLHGLAFFDLVQAINSRRNHTHGFTCMKVKSVPDLVQTLQKPQPELITQLPLKPIVLTFSGQTDNKVGLDESFYRSHARFRHHIDSCDRQMQELGFGSLLPTIFKDTPIKNIVTLQCGIFAVQFASARCWIDAGLEVHAVIGHSIGELTALAISEALSLRDAVKLVAARADLIENKWGDEKGQMIALNGGNIKKMEALAKSFGLEVACYNSDASLIAAGSAKDVQRLRSNHVGSRCLNTSHGFHSRFIDPILSDLDLVSNSLDWKRPQVQIEPCTERSSSEGLPLPSQHARRPVYFSNAVQRLEERLGPCIWLEAGFNSPITSMTKKAVTHVQQHDFISLSDRKSGFVDEAVCDAICELWRKGSRISFSAFHGDGHRTSKVWLPPYQFDKQQHWIPHVDKASEYLQELQKLKSCTVTAAPQLLTRKSDALDFVIDQGHNRFQSIVGGHAVCGRPLCPASMYLEIVVIGLRMLGIDASTSLNFESVAMDAPLGLNTLADKECVLSFVSIGAESWTFKVSTASTAHCAGKVVATKESDLRPFATLVHNSCVRLDSDPRTERTSLTKAYKLFESIVIYADFYQGISSVNFLDGEVSAVVSLPPGAPPSAGETSIDAVLFDIFIHVGGLAINTSEFVLPGEVAVATALERATISNKCSSTHATKWRVYSTYKALASKKISLDVFVCTDGGDLVATLVLNFKKILKLGLAKALDVVNARAPTTDQQTEKASTPLQPGSAGATKAPVEAEGKQSSITELKNTIADCLGIKDPKSIPSDKSLADLGLDSLASMDLTDSLSKNFAIDIDSTDLGTKSLSDLLGHLPNGVEVVPPNYLDEPKPKVAEFVTGVSASPQSSIISQPFKALSSVAANFDMVAEQRGFTSYWKLVAPLQDELVLAYVVEAFKALGLDFHTMQIGREVPRISVLPKYNHLLQRLEKILLRQRMIEKSHTAFLRGPGQSRQSLEILRDLEKHSAYRPEIGLMSLAGPSLAKCLRGDVEATSVMFGDQKAMEVNEEVYFNTPMIATSNDLCAELVVNSIDKGQTRPARILEVGAGTGATTEKVLEHLEDARIPFTYTFTDIAPTFVSKVKKKYANLSHVDFSILDLESEIPEEFRNRFDIVIGVNCVHATMNKVDSCRAICETLLASGIVILVEVTRRMDWLDLTCGLLDSWWRSGGYPLQSARAWRSTLTAAGFSSVSFSTGSSLESRSDQLILGSKAYADDSELTADLLPGSYVETFIYKDVDGLEIPADVYVPTDPSPTAMPIALMIHGGGHMTLSRKAIRPAQTKHLISNGFVPVSLDFRLCPEIDVFNGPFTDVRDGYEWARTKLPSIMLTYGVEVDTDRIVAIGWSTGGHLALSLGWTTKASGIPPPTAILSFYAPVDFEKDTADFYQTSKPVPERKMALEKIIAGLQESPITSSEPNKKDPTNLGFWNPDDPRSELVTCAFESGFGLPFLINGLSSDNVFERPSPSRIASMSPLARARSGDLTTPTFIAHGTDDPVAPFDASKELVEVLQSRGIRSELLALEGVGHIFDLGLRPGVTLWDEQVGPGYAFLIGMCS